ncbi:unnamed protein product [Symbiodinium microadriaticum]|nr:unnamed protein product [Symbiodinium microadriaticum]
MGADFNSKLRPLAGLVGRGFMRSNQGCDVELEAILQTRNLVLTNTWSSSAATRAHTFRNGEARKLWLVDKLQLAEQAAAKHDYAELYRIINQVAPIKRRERVRIRSKTGDLLTKGQQFSEIFEYFSTAFRADTGAAVTGHCCLSLSSEEIVAALAKLKRGKAVPASSVPTEIWQLCPAEYACKLESLLATRSRTGAPVPPEVSHCELSLLPKPGKDTRRLRDLRPLGLQDPSSKIYALALRGRLMEYIQPLLDEIPQYAYIPGKSIDQAIVRVAQHCTAIRSRLREGVTTVHQRRQGRKAGICYGGVMISIDLSRAVDSLTRQAMSSALDLELPVLTVDFIFLRNDICCHTGRASMVIAYPGSSTAGGAANGVRGWREVLRDPNYKKDIAAVLGGGSADAAMTEAPQQPPQQPPQESQADQWKDSWLVGSSKQHPKRKYSEKEDEQEKTSLDSATQAEAKQDTGFMLFVDTADYSDYSCLAKLREAGDQWQEQYANQKVTTALKVVLMSGLCVLLRSKVEELQQSEEHQARLIKVGWLSEGRTALDPVFHYYEWSQKKKKELRSAAQPLPLTEVLGTLEQYLPIPGVLTQFKATRQWSEVHRSEVMQFLLSLNLRHEEAHRRYRNFDRLSGNSVMKLLGTRLRPELGQRSNIARELEDAYRATSYCEWGPRREWQKPTAANKAFYWSCKLASDADRCAGALKAGVLSLASTGVIRSIRCICTFQTDLSWHRSLLFRAVLPYLAALFMPSIPEIFKMNSGEPDDEAASEPCEDVEHPSLEEPDQDETEDGPPRAQGPQLNVWRCLRCDSGRWTRNLYGTYLCMSCEGTEFYSCRQPHRRVTEDGVWMFMPRPAAAPAATDQDDQDSPPGPPKALSRRQRRRQRQEQQKAGGPPGPPSEPDTYSENPESDSCQDLCPASPPSSFGPTGTARPTAPPMASSAGPAFAKTTAFPNDRAAATPLHLGSSSSTAWKSKMGPEKGVRWRGGTPPQPPTWRYDHQDPRAYSKYAKKVSLWRIQVSAYMTPREAALLLYTSLTGEAETELEHAPIESINTDTGIDFILETLRTPMEQKLVFQKRKFLNEYENIQRQPNEALRAYSNRYRRAERNLRAVGIEVAQMYDDDSRGNRLLDHCGVDVQYPEFKAAPAIFGRDGQPLSRKGDGKGKDGAAAHPAPWQSNRPPKGGHGGKGGAPRRVYLTEQAEENMLDDVPEEEPADAEQPEDQDEDDAVTEDAPPDEPEVDAIAQAAEVLTKAW